MAVIPLLVLVPIVIAAKCKKYETCVKLHMFHILYISPGGIPLMFSQLHFIVLSIYIVQCTKYEACAKLYMIHILYISLGGIPLWFHSCTL